MSKGNYDILFIKDEVAECKQKPNLSIDGKIMKFNSCLYNSAKYGSYSINK